MLIVLALLLFVVVGAAMYVAAADGTGEVLVESFGLDVDIPVWGVFVAGAVTMLVVLAAVAALAAGLRAARSRRTEIRYLRQKVAHQELAEDQATTAMPVAGTTTGRTTTDSATDGVVDTGDDGAHRRLSRWRRHHADDKPPAEAAQN
ncbi:hypothetical protein [Jiangella anatolica]|uniref:Lipopolysaccharide assembly protein A domain-containing protein n=1 Tax=Jiangella anatolica TaxID=2670374 RepID=A0A2W2B9P0_9ACTN|nr:hypothetical protein [Jiangella anatolica]PZF84005.1 hypothetical protein C1I92_10165 [Jiangella anatolica]